MGNRLTTTCGTSKTIGSSLDGDGLLDACVNGYRTEVIEPVVDLPEANLLKKRPEILCIVEAAHRIAQVEIGLGVAGDDPSQEGNDDAQIGEVKEPQAL